MLPSYSWSSRVCFTLLKSKSSPVPLLKMSNTSCWSEKSFRNNQSRQLMIYQACCLKVGCGIIRFRDEQLTFCSIVVGLVDIADLKEFLLDGTQKVQSRLYLRLRVVSLHGGGDDGNEPSLGWHLVGAWHHGHVDVGLAPNLLLRNDDLSGQGILKDKENISIQ